ncbi:biotin--protein ligase 2-like isoform X4 [Camellia sinensis]|uniref:biotin--protein ligase 2-like isoform X4 n=1 Tax=Camellia sinensis TaxID=4442 RepID=UPI00103643A9|nr:biotin--protein ligase 2-like isoform X4 [Camellia sinensis]XP_028117739.1 biotin--protein ligase 2-like isoform X4 [Camellia sinensis]
MPFASLRGFLSLQTPLQFLPHLSPPTLLSTRTKQPLCLSVSFAASAMDSQSPCLLVLFGKSSTEKELAKSLKDNNSLKLPDNDKFSILLHSETRIPVEENCFRNNSFLNCLSTTRFGRFLIWSPQLPSTHDAVSHNFGELPIGAVCVADVQFKGRGRSKNVWESPRGCLLFSYTIQMEDGRVVPIVQYVVSLAMTEAIKDVCHKNGIPHLDVRIKWPNDLYLDGLKVGGILCTSTYKSKKFNISAGIGLNIDNEKPTTCLNAVLQKLTSVTYRLQREDILAAFFNKFETLFDLFIDKGFQPLEQLYYETWLHSGQRVIVQEKDEDRFVEKTVTIQGLTSSGYLLAVGEDGQMCELHPDGNRTAHEPTTFVLL